MYVRVGGCSWAEGLAGFVRMLVQHGANPNIGNADQRSPLHEAACNGHTKVVAILLTAGASIGMQDRGGDTPLHWAVCG